MKTPMMVSPLFRCLALLALLWTFPATAAERLIWKDAPIMAALPLNKEVVLRLPVACEVGVPPELQGTLRVEAIGSVVLLKSMDGFSEGRLALRATDNGQVYLLDVTRDDQAARELELIDPRRIAEPAAPAPSAHDASTGDPRVALTRFAAREFYAPERLRGGLSAVRVPVTQVPLPLYRGSIARTTPRAAWSYRGLYLTAIEVQNLTPDTRELDPRLLRGAWLAATFQHSQVGPVGSAHAQTMLYLISDRPFVQVVRLDAVTVESAP